ncbi:MAG: hypothetical protein JXJ04_20580 [Spirochaetales bacterium]|nr:hypothetical protein [Spirochaetales bacterium]
MSDTGDFSNINAGPNLRDETDLTGMDIADAKEYVLSYISTLKETQRALKVLSEELALWQSRVKFAQERGREDLMSAARMKETELSDKYARLSVEEKELSGKVQTLMENLKRLKAGFTPTVDAEQLAAELDMMTGGPDKIADDIKEEETMAELEKLKQRMKDEGSV